MDGTLRDQAGNICGDLLFADTRAGQASGCVREFLGDSAD